MMDSGAPSVSSSLRRRDKEEAKVRRTESSEATMKLLDDTNNNEEDDEISERVVRRKKPLKSKRKLRTFRERCMDLIELIIPERKILYQYLKQTLIEIKKSKLNYFLGFFACFLVVATVALMLSILHHTPIVFTRLAELEQGEIDLTLGAETYRGYRFINHTAMTELINSDGGDVSKFRYHSPRFEITTASYPVRNCETGIPDWSWKDDLAFPYVGVPNSPVANVSTCETDTSPSNPYLCIQLICGNPSRSRLILVDSQREHDMAVGKEWELFDQTNIPNGTVFMYADLASQLGLKKGDSFFMRVDLNSMLNEIWSHPYKNYIENYSINSTSSPAVWQYVYIPLKVGRIYSSSLGKHPVDQDNVILLEYSTFISLAAEYLHPDVPDVLRSQIASIDLYHFAKTVNFNFPPPRYDIYTNSDQDLIYQEATAFAYELLYRIGFDQVSGSMPVLQILDTLKYFNMFLGLILNVIIFILLFLSILLIYSLLMMSVETRTFEIGIMRMVGATRKRVVQLILCQAFTYIVPSWVLGLIVGQLLMFVGSWIFKIETKIQITAFLSFNAISVASILGFGIPIVSAIFPIRSALQRNVLDAIDTRRSKTTAVEIQIERSEDANTPLSLVAVGFCLTAFGFGIYYLIPLALLSENISLLVNVFFALLICMLLGLVLLSMNLQNIYERILVTTTLFWEKKAVTSLVLKNLTAHRRRNRKTAVMYALSLGFIIFMYTAYRINIDSILYLQKMRHGTTLSIYTWRTSLQRIVEPIEAYMANSSYVTEWAWQSQSLRWSAGDSDESITNLGHVFRDGQTFYAITPNLFDIVEQGFTNVYEMNDTSQYSLFEQLYTPQGSGSAIIGTLYQTSLGIEKVGSPFLFQQNFPDNSITFAMLNALGFMNAAPIFRFSQFPNRKNQDALISFTTYLRLCRMKWGNYRLTDIPLRAVYLKLKPNMKSSEMALLKGDLGRIIQTSRLSDVVIYDYNARTDIINLVDIAISFFFGFTIVIAMIICFFSLVSSMYTNVYEQAKEIGVLRALGMPIKWMIRTYVYEAFVLVFSSSLLGIVIGTGVAWIISVQRFLFTQVPVPFAFPWINTVVVFLLSLLSAVFSSYGPASRLLKNPIVQILRML
eukprot:TRINITY_DN4044_c0_g3_i1.p1 TRINITY_DN4044_c0_g3~~TRINITY_DN4044_c0_g3_i1.p1  ORF type:complete len:1119 (+),score=191.24 TRINITY_DN4044_c0_g3_i1:127-3483(+)